MFSNILRILLFLIVFGGSAFIVGSILALIYFAATGGFSG